MLGRPLGWALGVIGLTLAVAAWRLLNVYAPPPLMPQMNNKAAEVPHRRLNYEFVGQVDDFYYLGLLQIQNTDTLMWTNVHVDISVRVSPGNRNFQFSCRSVPNVLLRQILNVAFDQCAQPLPS